VLEIPDDAFMRYVSGVGVVGPDQGKGGKYLFMGPDCDGNIPEGYFVAKSTTYRHWLLMRVLYERRRPEGVSKKAERRISCLSSCASKKFTKAKRYDLSAVQFNTIHANDERFYEELNAAALYEPADAFDPERVGLFASIGIKKGKPFSPDARMQKLLKDAARSGTLRDDL